MGQGETSGEHFWERKVSRTLPLTPILFRYFHQSYQSKDRKDPVGTQTITNSWIFPNCLKGRKTINTLANVFQKRNQAVNSQFHLGKHGKKFLFFEGLILKNANYINPPSHIH